MFVNLFKKGYNWIKFPNYANKSLRGVIGLTKQSYECKIVNIFLPINFNMCFRCSKEPSH